MSRADHAMFAIVSGAGPALAAAALFGASTPLAKLLLRGTDPWMLAGILYLGSGVGLAALRIVIAATGRQGVERVRGQGWLWLGSAIVAGGVGAPVLLMMGLARSSASTAALLLNLESVFTALLAWLVFREHVGHRIAVGMLSIVAGGLVLAAGGPSIPDGWVGPVLITAACLGWAIDNNLTRNVSATDPVYLAMLKGGVAGAANVAIARWMGSPWPAPTSLGTAGLVGFLGYGLSLVLFIVALRGIGVARTAAYFSLAPFFGAAIAVVLLRDPVTVPLMAAGTLMAVGIWIHLTERHEHEHPHREPSPEPATAPADEEFSQEAPDAKSQRVRPDRDPVRHSHPHYPDSEHRHEH